VAMYLPVVRGWARGMGLMPSKLLIPLSYAAILGGMCTLIGTSTNLVIYGLWIAEDQAGTPSVSGVTMGMFTVAMIGLPAATVGLLYLMVLGPKLLPERGAAVGVEDEAKKYTVEMTVDIGGPMVGKTVERAGLRRLPGLFLIEIERDGDVIAAVSPDRQLRGGDRLIFAGVVDAVADLRQLPGLTPAEGQVFKLNTRDTQRALIEAVVSDTCPLVGKSIREGQFRGRYQAAVIAVARNGEQVRGRIGDIVLQAGDTLLLEAHRAFASTQRNSTDFYLVSALDQKQDNSAIPRHHKWWVAMLIVAGLVAAVSSGAVSLLTGALLAAGAMWLTRCVSAMEARESVQWPVLLAIGASLGLGKAVETSGLADSMVGTMLSWVGQNPLLALIGVYILTNLLTEVVTNTAAAVLMYPVAKAAAIGSGAEVLPFVLITMVAASASFATPLGYQTNLMVMGPGGYRYSDFVRFGMPLTILVGSTSVFMAWLIWL